MHMRLGLPHTGVMRQPSVDPMRGMTMRTLRSVATIAVGVMALLLPACGGDDGADGGSSPALTSAAETSASGEESVAVTLQEFAVGLDPASAEAGPVTFDVTNIGPDDVHEFVVIATELAATDLPTDADGAVDEEGEGIEVVDEIEDIPVDGNETLTVDLAAGSYVLICNIVEDEDGEVVAHYANGMRTEFAVG
jgi:hypothetical protein